MEPTSTGATAPVVAGESGTDGARPIGRRGKARRRWQLLGASVILIAIASATVIAIRSRSEATPVASSVKCAVYWRDNVQTQPSHAGDVSLTTRNPPLGDSLQRLVAGKMGFVARVPNSDPGFRQGPGSDGSDLIIEVTDSQGRLLIHQLYQIWSGPTDNFGGNTGFTGLVYVTDPATTAEVQYSCSAME